MRTSRVKVLSVFLIICLFGIQSSSARRHHNQNSEVAEILTAGLIASILMKGGSNSMIQALRHPFSDGDSKKARHSKTEERAPPPMTHAEIPLPPMVHVIHPPMVHAGYPPMMVHTDYPPVMQARYPAVMHFSVPYVYPVVYQPQYVMNQAYVAGANAHQAQLRAQIQKSQLDSQIKASQLDKQIQALADRENMLKAYLQARHRQEKQREVFEQIISHGGTTILSQVPSAMNQMPRALEQMPTGLNRVPTSIEQIPTGLNQMRGALQQIPPELNQMPAALQQIPTELNQMPGALQQIPTELNQMPGTLQQMPTSLEQMSGALKQMPMGLNQMSTSIETMPTELNLMPTSLEHMPAVMNHMPTSLEHMPLELGEMPSALNEMPTATVLFDSTDIDRENTENMLRHLLMPEMFQFEEILPTSGIGGPRVPMASASEIKSRYLLPRIVKHFVQRLFKRNKYH